MTEHGDRPLRVGVNLAWLVPGVAQLRRNLILCYAAASLLQAAVAGILMVPLPDVVETRSLRAI